MSILQKLSHRTAIQHSGRRMFAFAIFRNWPRRAASQIVDAWKLLRPHQWAKNLLVLLPLVAANRFSLVSFFDSVCAFVAFSLAASAGYIVNDLLDRNADRSHPFKHTRPLARGSFSPVTAAFLAATLYGASLLISIVFSGPLFSSILACYCGASLLYSWKLKEFVVVDVVALAAFYVLRMVAGGVATSIVLPAWLAASGFFFFCSLAMLKRYAELHRVSRRSGFHLPRRGYRVQHMSKLGWAGPLIACVAILAMVFATVTDNAGEVFSGSAMLYPAGMVTFLWLLWLWKLAWNGQMSEDPVAFALRDAVSYAAGGMVILLFCLPS